MSLHRESPIPFQCPHCGKHKGLPIGIAVDDGHALVAVVRCKECEHMWQVNRQPDETWAGADRDECQLVLVAPYKTSRTVCVIPQQP
jgi:hypothetical protein